MLLSVLAPPRPRLTPAEVRREERRAPVDARRQRPLRRPPLRRLVADAQTAFALLVVAGATALVTGLNISGSPHYESDEGTYVGSAWSMFTEGKLSYYTYNYDHPPFGWFLIGLWAKLVGGFTELGSSVVTARVLMVFVAVASSLLIFTIIRRATGSRAAAMCAALLFAVSPLATPLHRQVWLDNLATLFLLASIYLMLGARWSLSATFFSAVAFGLSFWTKEVMVVLLPGMLVLVGVASHVLHRRFALAVWAATAVSIISVFVLLAFLKDELLPPGVLWSSPDAHVSLLETYSWQASRDGAGSILSATSDFRRLFDAWWQSDPTLVLGGLAEMVLALVLFRSIPFAGAAAVLALTYLAFLARGGVVLFYYVIPVLAILALVFGLLQGYALRMLGRVWRPLGSVVAAGLVLLSALHTNAGVRANSASFTEQPTAAQDQARKWIIDNLPRESVILMDSYAYVELRDPADTGGQPFDNAEYYWPGVSDPSVRDGVLHDDWRTIDYLAVSPSIEADISNRQLPILPDALANSDEIQNFYSDNWSVRILRVRKLNQVPASSDPLLTGTWATYTNHFVHAGRVIDPQSDNTTSEAQADTLLRAVYSGDQATFDQVWSWTRDHLQTRESDALFSWRWGSRPDGTEGLLETNTAADADETVALSLLFAARRWNQASYEAEAARILNDIWAHETAVVADRRVLVGGTWAIGEAGTSVPDPVVNPSYFQPYAYRIFQAADPGHAWLNLVDSGYDVLGQIRTSPQFGGTAGVVPNWVALDPVTGDLKPAYALGANWSQFGYDSSRVQWHLALDGLWFGDNRAKEALQGISLPYHELTTNKRLLAAYTVDGQPAANYEATSRYATALAGVLVGQNRDLALSVFSTKVLHTYQSNGADRYWGDLNSFYDQNWSWFATALVDGGMANLWSGQDVINWDEALP